MESADERLAGAAAGVLRALGRVDQPPAPMHADVVVGPKSVCVVLVGAHYHN